MKRISLYASVPYLLMALLYNNAYFDLYITTVSVICIISIIRGRISFSVFTFCFTLLAFFLCSNSYSVCNKSFYPLLDQPVTLICMVDETPAYQEDGIQFSAKALYADNKGNRTALKEKTMVFVRGNHTTLKYGDEIEFKTIIQLPGENSNDGGFNYRDYLRSQNIYTICNTYDYAIINNGICKSANPIIYRIYSIRSSVMEKFDRFFEGDVSAFLKALVTGYQKNMSDTLTATVNRAGISHVISVSGLHLSIMMVMINMFLQKLNFKGSVLIIPVLNIMCALFITAFTGFSPSVKRSAIMLIISNSASLVYRENDSVQSLAFACLILSLANPCAINDVRLVLSAASTLGIIVLYEKSEKFLGKYIMHGGICTTVSMSLSAQIFTMPFCAAYFGTISILGIITNIIVVPLIPFLMGMCIILIFIPFEPICAFLSDGIWAVTQFILKISGLISSVHFAQVNIGIGRLTYDLLWIISIFFLIKAILNSKSIYKNSLNFLCICVCVISCFFPPRSKSLRLTIINVGQGDCSLIEFPDGKTMLIDGGGIAESDYDTAESIIEPYLVQNGIRKIDYAVISHFHADHANGIISLADRFPIGCIIAPDYLKADKNPIIKSAVETFAKNKIPLYLFDKGDSFAIDSETILYTYSPCDKYIYEENDSSLVFRITAYGRDILFTGDIEYNSRHILQKEDISCDILKVPHHGDYSDTDSDFLDSTSPEYAYICVGVNNAYNHPDKETLALMADKNIKLARTDYDKTIRYIITPDGNIKIK